MKEKLLVIALGLDFTKQKIYLIGRSTSKSTKKVLKIPTSHAKTLNLTFRNKNQIMGVICQVSTSNNQVPLR